MYSQKVVKRDGTRTLYLMSEKHVRTDWLNMPDQSDPEYANISAAADYVKSGAGAWNLKCICIEGFSDGFQISESVRQITHGSNYEKFNCLSDQIALENIFLFPSLVIEADIAIIGIEQKELFETLRLHSKSEEMHQLSNNDKYNNQMYRELNLKRSLHFLNSALLQLEKLPDGSAVMIYSGESHIADIANAIKNGGYDERLDGISVVSIEK